MNSLIRFFINSLHLHTEMIFGFGNGVIQLLNRDKENHLM